MQEETGESNPFLLKWTVEREYGIEDYISFGKGTISSNFSLKMNKVEYNFIRKPL
jgi:hypothetical protein